MVTRYLGVIIPDVQVCKGHSTPWRAFCDGYFARYPYVVWKAARGLGGKSYMLATLGWMEAVTLQSGVNILGGSGEQSERVHDYLRQFWMRPEAPVGALASDPSKRETRLIWPGVKISAQLASPRSVRGAHEPRLRVDEADEVEWGILDSARGQPMAKRDGAGTLIDSNIVFSSTHQYADGTMTRLIKEARERGFPVHEWCWRETVEPHGWLSLAAMERYRQTVSAELWRVEVELGEPSPEGRAILPELVEDMFSLPNEKYGIEAGVDYRDREGEYFELEAPVAGGQYATGADWGKQDETVIWTFRCDVYPMRMVAYEHLQRRPMPAMIERLMERQRRYRGEAFHDATGVGTYHHDQFTEPVEDYVMQGKKRNDLFMNYITAIERGEVVAPRLISAYHAHKYCRNKDLFTEREAAEATALGKGGKGHPPDPFVAAALAYAASESARSPLGVVGSSSGSDRRQFTGSGTGKNTAVGLASSFLGRRES